MEQNSNNIPELQSPFEQLREVDTDGKEWWNSRKLARVMGYGKSETGTRYLCFIYLFYIVFIAFCSFSRNRAACEPSI